MISQDYVRSVLNALEGVNGQAAQLIVNYRSVVPAALQRLQAITSPPEFAADEALWEKAVKAGLRGFGPKARPVAGTPTRIVSASADCIISAITLDAKLGTPASRSTYITLVPKDTNEDPSGLNPTPWVISFLGYTANGAPPSGQCTPP